MRLTCPYCGTRDSAEFTYLGDALLMRRPSAEASAEDWHAYVYLRDNPAGAHRELWYHAQGCRTWLVVDRDTKTHAVDDVIPAKALPR
jgi:sarcosine oxidase subunit delta